MAVLAVKNIAGNNVQRYFECGQFDLLLENGGFGWTELWRDCDIWTQRRRTLWPFASGPKGTANAAVVSLESTLTRFRKYFPANDDDFQPVLDLSDVNDGVLCDPLKACEFIEVQQNGKKLPCEAYTVNFVLSNITVLEPWRSPGEAYEVLFWALPAPT